MSDAQGEREQSQKFRKAAVIDGLLWLALLVLVAMSILAAKTLHASGFHTEMACACLQVALIAAFFMQLRGARPLILLTAASASVFLLSMFVLSLNDLFTRL